MKKVKSAIILTSLIMAAGCASTNVAPPKNTANACSILDEKSGWEKHTFNSAYKWGVSPGTILSFMKHESAFKHNARPIDKNGNKASSALGYSQALDATWADYIRTQGNGKRKKFSDSADFIGWYLDHISKVSNVNKNDPKALYLAYHEGPGGYKRGSYKGKSWLINYAQKVASQAEVYDNQLSQCEKGKMKKFDRLAQQ